MLCNKEKNGPVISTQAENEIYKNGINGQQSFTRVCLFVAIADSNIHNFCRLCFALPFLPAHKIPKAVSRLFRKANTAELQELVSYIRSNWIDSQTWPPECRSVYRRVIRINNDVEG